MDIILMQDTGQIQLKGSGSCIDVNTNKNNEVCLKVCDPQSKRQKFEGKTAGL